MPWAWLQDGNIKRKWMAFYPATSCLFRLPWPDKSSFEGREHGVRLLKRLTAPANLKPRSQASAILPPFLFLMVVLDSLTLRDSSVIGILNLFGISYFSVFTLQRLLFHFPASNADICSFLAVLLFGVGFIYWSCLSLTRRTLLVLGSSRSPDWEVLDFVGVFLFIYSTAISFVSLQFAEWPSIQLGYICAITWIFVAHLAEVLEEPSGAPIAMLKFQYHATSLVLLTLGPVIHAFVGEFGMSGPLAAAIARFSIYNGFGTAQYVLQPLERMGFFRGWQPSLYIMHLVLLFSAVRLSVHILPVAHVSSA